MVAHEAHLALSWRDLQDLVGLCADLAVSARELIEKEYKRLFKESDLTVAWLQERRQVIEELSDSYLQLAASVKTLACRAWQAAGSPAGADFAYRLDGAIQAVAQAKQNVLERWPVGSDEEIAAARASAARGEGLDVDEAFAQIAGVDVETWLKRVQDHERDRHE
jgi:hypothetical protein